jgi:hypothetical protein
MTPGARLGSFDDPWRDEPRFKARAARMRVDADRPH